MKNFEKVKQLNNQAMVFETFWQQYKERTSQSQCDKFSAAFNSDGRWAHWRMEIFFDAHTGNYGNSSCSSFGSINGELAKEYFPRALNCMKEQIFQKMSELMKKDAMKSVSEAEREIEAMQKLLNEVKP